MFACQNHRRLHSVLFAQKSVSCSDGFLDCARKATGKRNKMSFFLEIFLSSQLSHVCISYSEQTKALVLELPYVPSPVQGDLCFSFGCSAIKKKNYFVVIDYYYYGQFMNKEFSCNIFIHMSLYFVLGQCLCPPSSFSHS